MVGCYKVTFNFAETFAPDTSYKYHPRYHESGIEYVFAIENSEKKIVLQHLLVAEDSLIIKHWRQDWLFENTDFLIYQQDNEWKKEKRSPSQVKGQWTQKVFQVDDSPRYEGSGTWVHIDGRHYWESTSDAPLPRREFTKRNDYNVMKRGSHIEINSDGWILEQDNQKIIRKNGADLLLCQEKGLEQFTKKDYNCQLAENYWEKNKQFWTEVRNIWENILTTNNQVSIEKKVKESLLYEKLFRLERMAGTSSGGSSMEIEKAIQSHLKKS
jgi:hypothetical protein